MSHRLLLSLLFGVMISFAAHADDKLSYPLQGTPRTAILHVPIAAAGHMAPLVIVLHGLGGSGDDFQKWSAVDLVADREGFVAVYPDAIDGRWSYGRPIIGPMPVVNGETVDDVSFIRLLIDDLVKRGIADRNQIYVTGMSRGALMAFTLGCALSDMIAAIAPVASSMTDHQIEDCKPQRPLPVMMVNGTSDYSQPYDGFLFQEGRLTSVPETLEYWRSVAQCTGMSGSALDHLHKKDRTRVIRYEWEGCKAGSGMRYYRIENGGHRWPALDHERGTDPMTSDRFGGRNNDIDTATEAWAFFKQYPLH